LSSRDFLHWKRRNEATKRFVGYQRASTDFAGLKFSGLEQLVKFGAPAIQLSPCALDRVQTQGAKNFGFGISHVNSPMNAGVPDYSSEMPVIARDLKSFPVVLPDNRRLSVHIPDNRHLS
jgi:hypothetical protein